MPVCGPKLSLCCTILSIWGVVQLALMGVFFFIHSVAFVEDLTAEFSDDEKLSDLEKLEKFYQDVDDSYQQTAINCWIAAGVYSAFFLFSLQQFRANRKV